MTTFASASSMRSASKQERIIQQTLSNPQSERDMVFSEMSYGWPDFLQNQIDLISRQNNSDFIDEKKSYVLLFGLAPRQPLDFRTGELLRRSLQNSAGIKSAGDGGHMMIGWQCHAAGEKIQGMAALTGERTGQSSKMLRKGWGVNSYLSTFTDGFLQKPDDFQGPVLRRILKDRPDFSFVLIEVAPKKCIEGLSFVHQFNSHQSQPWKNFGSLHNTLNFEGGGCLSFAYSFLKKTGVFNQVLDHFWRTMKIPNFLFGKGQTDANGRPVFENPHGVQERIPNVQLQTRFFTENQNPIGALEFLRSSWEAPPNTPFAEVRQIDPELPFLFFRELSEKLIETSSTTIPSEIARAAQHRRRIISHNYENLNGENAMDFFKTYTVNSAYDSSEEYGWNARNIQIQTHNWVMENRYTYNSAFFPLLHGYGIKLEKF